MKTKIRSGNSVGMLLAMFVIIHHPVFGQPAEQLKPFERFVGNWILDNSLQVFEWGPGRTSVIGKSYQIESDESRTLLSHGMWVWHPGEQRIKGYISATNMPITFFDYSTKFENGRMVSDLAAYDKNGNKSVYEEVMEINSDSTYKWTLFQNGKAIMEGIYVRKSGYLK